MQRREWQLRIEDMINAIAEIQEFIGGLDAASFQTDRKTLRAIEYNFVVLGEAARSVPDEIKGQFPGVPWSRVIGLRNIVAHHYQRVDPDILWDTIRDDLPSLVEALRSLRLPE